MPSLLSLPPEIQLNIIKYLKCPELTRVRMTCRFMRDLPTPAIRHQACLDLEADWIKADDQRGNDGAPAHMIHVYHQDYGYAFDDIRKIRFFAPCFTCYNLHREVDFEIENGNEPLSFCDHLGYSWNDGKVNEARICIGCLVQKYDVFKNRNEDRWIITRGYRLVACTECKQIKTTARKVCHLQHRAIHCTSCFQGVLRVWSKERALLLKWKDKINKQLDWMDEAVSNRDRYPQLGPEMSLWELEPPKKRVLEYWREAPTEERMRSIRHYLGQ